jgi:hypothetical protein
MYESKDSGKRDTMWKFNILDFTTVLDFLDIFTPIVD